MFNYNQLREEYDSTIFQQIRHHEKLARKLGRYTSHLRFNLQCKHTDIIPKSLKIKSSFDSNEARNVLHRAEKALLNLRVSETVAKRNRLLKEKTRIKNELKDDLSMDIYKQMIENNTRKNSAS